MDCRLDDILNNRQGNYVLPFLWVSGKEQNVVKNQISAVFQSGARSFCVESRTFENFCKDDWWNLMDFILKEAERLGMKVWLLDDKHFPTGYANNLIRERYPEKRKWQLIEHHVDVVGPMKGASVATHNGFDEDKLIGVYAYPRAEEGEELLCEPVELSTNMQDRFLYWDIPPGFWRIFFFYKSRKGAAQNKEYHIHFIDEDSVRILIKAVYEPHYEHYKLYFGNVFAGFFSDEPSFGNGFFNPTVSNPGVKYETLGLPGLALPWSDRLAGLLDESFDGNAYRYLAGLWYPLAGKTEEIRYFYMDKVTRLYQNAFSCQIGNWCHAHGVEYIGHVIEDMNAHGRLGCGTGHYFRALDGQDMSGMDIVLHQILPGFAHYKSSAVCSGGVVDPDFYHYVLAKLCSSMAQLNPKISNRSLCEVFGAYGWAEGVPMMKWLADYLLVRGINHFVPHAFSPTFPNTDCPPHFYAKGNDPQFEGFCKLTGYINRTSHFLFGGKSTARTAILYHAEAEWMNGNNCMLTDKPAKVLYDAHIDYEIVPMDYILADSIIINGIFNINEISFDCLIIPFAPMLPPHYYNKLNELLSKGVTIIMVYSDKNPIDKPFPFKMIELNMLPSFIKSIGALPITVEGNYPLLRVEHLKRGKTDIFMFFNESVELTVDTKVWLPCMGKYNRIDFLNEEYFSGFSEDGVINLLLSPYESTIIAYGCGWPDAREENRKSWKHIVEINILWDISLKESGISSEFKPFRSNAELSNITGRTGVPDFSGVIRYQGQFDFMGDPIKTTAIDLGMVGQISHLILNNVDLGLRICSPYRYAVGEALHPGTNSIIIEVANTLVHRVPDNFSMYLQIPPSGLQGPISILQKD